MTQYFGYIASFFIGMIVADIIWMNKFGIFLIWRARWTYWKQKGKK